jgi:protoporphyrinogen oxidase
MTDRHTRLLILGAGLAGLSVARWTHRLGPLLLEKSTAPGGHLRSDAWAGATWDQGPHVSFTRHEKVREVLASDLEGGFREFPSIVENYDQGLWIPHPIQSHLYALPEHTRLAAAESFRRRGGVEAAGTYAEWLHGAYGPFIAEEYMGRYTRKYWTCGPEAMGTDWVGLRMRVPTDDEVRASLAGPAASGSHYITTVRYPTRGGFSSYLGRFIDGADIRRDTEVLSIDLVGRRVHTTRGEYAYERLVNTMPLPEFVCCCIQATPEVREAAGRLRCTGLWLVDVLVPHGRRREFHWCYVYDRDKLSTRITHMDALAPGNAPAGTAAIQVEVYDSPYRALGLPPDCIRERVVHELRTMGLVDGTADVQSRVRRIPYANVLFDREQRSALDTIWSWAEDYGLLREPMDLHPLTDWAMPGPARCGDLSFAGRFGQWKYAWTDDCILRGMALAEALAS